MTEHKNLPSVGLIAKARSRRRGVRRGRGRPRKDARDQLVVDLTAALMENTPLGPQQARDLALAWLEGKIATATKLPRGAHKAAPHSVLLGHVLPVSFEGRSEAIRDKQLKPRPAVVAAFSELLVAKDTAAIVRAFVRHFARLVRAK